MILRHFDQPSEKLHIAFTIEGLHNISGGAERVLADITRGLYLRGHRITVLTHEGRNGPSFYQLKFGIERIDVRPRHSRRNKRPPLDQVSRLGHRSMLFAAPIWLVQFGPKIWRLRRGLRKARPDVVVGFMPSMFPYTTLAALGLSMKTVVSIHNVPTREFGADNKRWNQNRMDIRIRRLSLRIASAVTVLLPSFKEKLGCKSVRDKTHIIPNMIHSYDGPLADVMRAPAGNTILAVGRLADAKDHQSLIEAWAQLEEKYPDWQVKIFGDGPLKDSLSRQIRLLGIKRLKIHKPTKEIMKEYQAAKLLAMPSRYEGFGLVTAEALSVGLPVVGFQDCPGTNELVKDGHNGLLAEAGEPRAKAFACALGRILEDEDLRVRLAANAPASVEKFAPDHIVDYWEELLLSLVQKKPAHA